MISYDKCNKCGGNHSPLFLEYYVWEDSGDHIDILDIDGWLDGNLDWASAMCGLTPETAVNVYAEKHIFDDISDGDDCVVWIRPVSDERFGLRKYTVTAEIEVNYTSERLVKLVEEDE